MSRILIRGEIYERVASQSLYEATLESAILASKDRLFPFGLLFPFKRRVSSPVGDAEPDMVLIDREFRRWWILEIELSHHDLHSHVMRQVAVFSEARYGAADADYLLRTAPELGTNEERLINLIRRSAPSILVIADRWNADWARAIRQHDAKLGVIEIFRSARNETLLRLDGDLPDVDSTTVSVCEQYNALGRALLLVSPERVEPFLKNNGMLSIWLDDGATEWKWLKTGSLVLLYPCGRCPIDERYRYFELVTHGDSSLFLKPFR